MNARRALVVLNPRAARCSPEEVRRALKAALAPPDWSLEVHEMLVPGGESAVGQVVERAVAERRDLVVVAGGDGTVALVADHLVGSAIPLGIIPVGTGNVVALDLGVPPSVGAAAALLAGPHRVREVDGMLIAGRHYFLQAGAGFDSLVMRDTDRRVKRVLGWFAYVITVAAKAVGYHSHRFTLRIDGRRVHHRAWMVIVANVGALGSPLLRWGPNIRTSDGRLDVVVLNVRGPRDYLELLWRVLTLRRRRGPAVRYYRVSRQVTIDADPPLPTQADGELLGRTPLAVRVVPRALRVIVPPDR